MRFGREESESAVAAAAVVALAVGAEGDVETVAAAGLADSMVGTALTVSWGGETRPGKRGV